MDQKPSTAWHRASRPVEAVTLGGMDMVSSGSTRATSGKFCGGAMAGFARLALCVITEKGVTSLPVPAVVGMAITGRPLVWHTLSRSRYSRMEPGFRCSMAITLAASRALPPPSPITRSHPASLHRAAPRSTVSIEGFSSTSANTSRGSPCNFCKALSTVSLCFGKSFAVTRKALFPFNSSTTWRISLNRPHPNRIRVGM